MQTASKAVTKEVELTLIIKGEKKVVKAGVINYQIGMQLPDLPRGGDPVTIRKIINEEVVKYDYLPLYCSFDIETTNIITEESKAAYMYHWQLSLVSNEGGFVFLGRTWSQFIDLYNRIVFDYKLGIIRKLLVWIANEGFEFQFIRKRFSWDADNFFAREERHPMAAMTTEGVDFHEALTISGGSLAQLAKDYTTTQKLKGDLDYSVLRSYKTPLTEQEQNYCINDVTILSEWSSFIFDKYIYPDHKIPLTKTGLLRSEIKEELKNLLSFQEIKTYKELIYNAFPDEKTYSYWFRWLFRGGYVHSNILNTGYTIENALGFDETSAYPAWMNFGYYPGTPFRPIYDYDIDEIINKYCCIITVDFVNIERRTAISYESKHKCMELEGNVKDGTLLIDNGRIAKAKRMKVVLTELDYKIYKRLYKWDEEKTVIKCVWISDKIRLPQFILNVLNRHYKAKAKMKQAGLSGTPEYAIEKSGINAAYGMMVTRIELDSVAYDEEWILKENAIDFEKERSKQILLPQWGIWVTAHARYALFLPAFEIIDKIGDDVIIYNDTDSHKVKNVVGVKEIFDKYNKWIAKKIKACGLTDPAFADLGMYDLESPNITRIKCLGAKRYLTEEDGKVKATVAGMPKGAVLNIKGDPFKAFSEWGMTLTADISEKNTIHYSDDPTEWKAPDGCIMKELSSAAIFAISFSLKVDKFYRQLIEETLTERRKLGGC